MSACKAGHSACQDLPVFMHASESLHYVCSGGFSTGECGVTH